MGNHKYLVKKSSMPVPGVVVLDVADKRGRPVFNFKPGQYAMLSYRNESGRIPDKHAFSIASSPAEKKHLTFGIKILGKFTQGIAKLKEGDEVFISGPFGDFVFDERKHRDAVLITGGIGVTPFMSVMRYAADNRLTNRLSLVYSNRTANGALFYREIKELERRNKNMKALFCVTDEKMPCRVSGVLNSVPNGAIIGDFAEGVEGKNFFLCGPAGFMEAMKKELLGIGAGEWQVAMEEFSMIPDSGFWMTARNFSYAAGLAGLAMFLPFYLISNSGRANASGIKESLGSLLPDFLDRRKIYEAGREAYQSKTENEKKRIIAAAIVAPEKETAAASPVSSKAKSSSSNSKAAAKTKQAYVAKSATLAAKAKSSSSTSTKKSGVSFSSGPLPITGASAEPLVSTQSSSRQALANSSSIPSLVTQASPRASSASSVFSSEKNNSSADFSSAPPLVTHSSQSVSSVAQSSSQNNAVSSVPSPITRTSQAISSSSRASSASSSKSNSGSGGRNSGSGRHGRDDDDDEEYDD